jgi:hypothetical protein
MKRRGIRTYKEQVMPVSDEVKEQATPRKRNRKKAAVAAERPIKYPDRIAEVRLVKNGDPIDAALAKELLGWEELDDSADNYLLIDESGPVPGKGKKIQCVNNTHNRPFNETWARTIAQDILNRHWRDNGEAIVIGRTGRVLSGQHRLIGLVLADQMWSGKNAPHWKSKWPEGPLVIESTLSLGVSEESETVRTLDNVRPRTFSDVLYTEENVFGSLSPSARKEAIRNLDYCVRFLWNRTGQSNQSYGYFNTYRTHSEAIDFLHNHPHIFQAVEHVTGLNERPKSKDENGKVIVGAAPVTQVVGSAGIASGIEYLAGCSATSPDGANNYHDSDPRAEKKGKRSLLDWSRWEKAQQFLEDLLQLEQVREVMIDLLPAMEGDLKISQAAKAAVIVKAWNFYVEDQPFTAEDITPETVVDGFGNRIIAESPILGGIDDGDRSFKIPKADGSTSVKVGTGDSEPEETPEDTDGEDSEDNSGIPSEDSGESYDDVTDAWEQETNENGEHRNMSSMTVGELTEEELEKRKNEQLEAREEKKRILTEKKKERRRNKRRDEMAQIVAQATARDGTGPPMESTETPQ